MWWAVSVSPEVVAVSNTARRLPMFEAMACSHCFWSIPRRAATLPTARSR